jgi:rhamnogalacturonyl hydrolase YesR
MNDDLETRLREMQHRDKCGADYDPQGWCDCLYTTMVEAADEIERGQKREKELEDAIKNFLFSEEYTSMYNDSAPYWDAIWAMRKLV